MALFFSFCPIFTSSHFRLFFAQVYIYWNYGGLSGESLNIFTLSPLFTTIESMKTFHLQQKMGLAYLPLLPSTIKEHHSIHPLHTYFIHFISQLVSIFIFVPFSLFFREEWRLSSCSHSGYISRWRMGKCTKG